MYQPQRHYLKKKRKGKHYSYIVTLGGSIVQLRVTCRLVCTIARVKVKEKIAAKSCRRHETK